ncbi:MAG: hypothetical protein QW103_00315 [Candidatus Pacearchaeota archaeon]
MGCSSLLDFNGREITRGPYIDSRTGDPIRVYNLGDGELRFASPYDLFEEDQKPPRLNREIASRLIRLNSPEGIQRLLFETQYVNDPRCPIDYLPRKDILFKGQEKS